MDSCGRSGMPQGMRRLHNILLQSGIGEREARALTANVGAVAADPVVVSRLEYHLPDSRTIEDYPSEQGESSMELQWNSAAAAAPEKVERRSQDCSFVNVCRSENLEDEIEAVGAWAYEEEEEVVRRGSLSRCSSTLGSALASSLRRPPTPPPVPRRRPVQCAPPAAPCRALQEPPRVPPREPPPSVLPLGQLGSALAALAACAAALWQQLRGLFDLGPARPEEAGEGAPGGVLFASGVFLLLVLLYADRMPSAQARLTLLTGAARFVADLIGGK